LPILDQLFYDPTRFVTRSVANHLNDISKINPDLALETLARWHNTGKQNLKEMDYMVCHALRTLIKQGHPKAMTMLGLSHAPSVSVKSFTVPNHVKMNTVLEFSFTIQAKEDTELSLITSSIFKIKRENRAARKCSNSRNLRL
jgi:hypothetical protein